MVNPLSNVEMEALEALVTAHNFPGVMSGLSAMCSRWKASVAGEAERDVLVIMEEFFELSAKESKLIVMAQRNIADVRNTFKHHEEFGVLLSPTLDPPDVEPEQ